MARAGIAVRAVDGPELEVVAAILEDARRSNPVGVPLGTPAPGVMLERLRAFVANTPGRVSVAESSGTIVGISIGQVELPGLFSEVPWLRVEVLYVREEWRRRGAGRALLADLAAFAQRCEIERIVTQPVSGSRSEARFLSRLGFSAAGPRRTIETQALVRRLDHPDAPRGGLEALIARRRVMNGQTPARGIPLGTVESVPDGAASSGGAAASAAGRVASNGDRAAQGLEDQDAEGASGAVGATEVAEAAPELGSSRQVRRAELMRRSSPSTISTR